MEKILLVDGNNLLFRSYYATAYNGNYMTNSKGFPTNALLGFANMINKILNEENPTYMIVAFDKGKTFRHEKYKDYKGGRNETPTELKQQFPIAKELLTYMGIKYYEIDNYEADDIIGTFSKYCLDEPDFIGTIISSDKDLLQLINNDVDIKLLKQKDYIRYNEDTFKEAYGINPINIIDLKALMGDSSDNIPGVKGIGEKTALKLLHDYKTLDGVYENLDKLTPKMREKLEQDKDNAYMSYNLATIVCNVPMEIDINDVKIKERNTKELIALYEELEFNSLLKKLNSEKKVTEQKKLETIILDDINNLKVTKDVAFYLEILGTNYHTSSVLGLSIYNDECYYFIPKNILKEAFPIIKKYLKYTYDYKKVYVALKWLGLELETQAFDTMIAAYLLEYNIKDDISILANFLDYDIPYYDEMYRKLKSKAIYEAPELEKIAEAALLKARFIYEVKEELEKKLVIEKVDKLYYDIELPLSKVLGDMELNGVYVNKEEMDKMGIEFKKQIDIVERDIYDYAGCEFNIASPIKLGEILFEKLELPHGKKNHRSYSTSIEVLEKLKDKHPIINKIIEYRMLTKLYTTYIEGLKNTILEDGKIHTIFTQTLTRTGRLSSIEPNLQNIPIRYEYGRMIRKAFIPSDNSIIISGDYSQIELRIMSHMANVPSLIDAFKKEIDIHTKTASDIFKVEIDEVTKEMRRVAKAVNFGIIYGISSYGLSENIGIKSKEAKEFIDKYFESYPGIKEYMNKTVEEAYQNNYVITLMNRRRHIPELTNSSKMVRLSGERIALNTPIQGTSADIIKKAMVDISKRFEKENIKSKMILQVHDELVFDTLLEEKDKVIEIVKDCMENVYPLNVPLKIDVEYGYNWYEAK